jgi:hypothetical protein
MIDALRGRSWAMGAVGGGPCHAQVKRQQLYAASMAGPTVHPYGSTNVAMPRKPYRIVALSKCESGQNR